MTETQRKLFTPILISGCLILMLGFSIRASFGVFQLPIANEFGWLRYEFSLAIAIQNLAWGVGQPIFGALAEKFGDIKAVILGAFAYALGLVLSSYATTPTEHQIYEILVGFGIAGTGFGVILAVVGRSASADNRSLAMGIATAAGSAGQVFGPPIANYLLGLMNWSSVFLIFAAAILLVLFFVPFLRMEKTVSKSELEQSMGQALSTALRDPSYAMIFFGFFSCGFQLAFITAHFPAFITEVCAAIDPNGLLADLGIQSTSALGAFSIAVIGVANIGGTILAGALGKKYSKKYLLVWIYTARTLIGGMFIIFPMTPLTVLLFSVSMGALWLATVPLTSGLIAYIYGLRYMGTLYGIVFFSHQLGSFLGVWLGGYLYDIYGSYNIVWWVGVAVGAFSAIIHIPVKEKQKTEERAIPALAD